MYIYLTSLEGWQVINTRVGDMASLNRIHEEINILQVLGNHPGSALGRKEVIYYIIYTLNSYKKYIIIISSYILNKQVI